MRAALLTIAILSAFGTVTACGDDDTGPDCATVSSLTDMLLDGTLTEEQYVASLGIERTDVDEVLEACS